LKTPAFLPGGTELAREALIVIGGAVIAALIVSRLPGLKQFIKDAWQ
jgi:hypothetical protein